MKWTRRAVVAGILGLVAAPSAGGADPGAGPAARLVVTGRIAEPGGRREFSRDEVEALGLSSFETRTPWYSGPMRFEGVPLRVLLEKLGASGDRLLALARDGYKGEIPLADLRHGPILATRRNGEPLTRDKGPFWIVYPYDSAPGLKSQTYYKRSIWQVVGLRVE